MDLAGQIKAAPPLYSQIAVALWSQAAGIFWAGARVTGLFLMRRDGRARRRVWIEYEIQPEYRGGVANVCGRVEVDGPHWRVP